MALLVCQSCGPGSLPDPCLTLQGEESEELPSQLKPVLGSLASKGRTGERWERVQA